MQFQHVQLQLSNKIIDYDQVYRVRQNGDREMLPYINSASNTPPKHRPERPKSTYGIRPTRPKSGRPKSALAIRPNATEAHPSTKRYGYDSLGRRVRLHNQVRHLLRVKQGHNCKRNFYSSLARVIEVYIFFHILIASCSLFF